jgi:hypothetical protein
MGVNDRGAANRENADSKEKSARMRVGFALHYATLAFGPE